MASYSVVVKDIADLQRRYAGAETVIVEELGRGMTKSMLAAEGAIKADVHDNARASGALMQSIQHRVEPIAGGIRGVAGPDARSATAPATSKNYAINVIKGRRPGKMPPIVNIMDWVTVKNQYTNIFGIESSDKAAVRRVAFAVARNIARRGIPPNDFMGRAIATVLPDIDREFRNAVPKRIRGRITGSGT